MDHCTVLSDGKFPFDGCSGVFLGSGPGSGGGGSGGGGTGGGGVPPPATFVLQVLLDTTGGSLVSSPAGINYNPAAGSNLFASAFPNGSSVSLTAAPPHSVNAYDVKWTGACSGTLVTASVVMSQDQHCYVSFTPTASR